MITGVLGGVTLQPFGLPFLETPIEMAEDIVTLDGSMYTDFTAQRREMQLNWPDLTLEQYLELREIYNDQFSTAAYPLFTCAYYNMDEVPCRMYINERDVRINGCEVYDVSVRLVMQNPLISDNNWLVNEIGEPIEVS